MGSTKKKSWNIEKKKKQKKKKYEMAKKNKMKKHKQLMEFKSLIKEWNKDWTRIITNNNEK